MHIGLHEKISTSKNLPNQLVKDMRFLATIRNKLIHERGFDSIPDRDGFIKTFERSVATLETLRKQGKGVNGTGAQSVESNCACIIS